MNAAQRLTKLPSPASGRGVGGEGRGLLMPRLFCIAVLWWLTFSPMAGLAFEQIQDYDARIEVHADGSLTVTETISVFAEGIDIKRGIYRDFPTTYRTWYGRVTVPFDVLSVKRNGAAEPWHTAWRDNGVRVYIGRSDRNIPRGMHTYEIRYRTDWQLGHFDAHDELYWNVTGNGWNFQIARAGATVVLPQKVAEGDLRLEAYTGASGDKGRDWLARVDAEGHARFITTAPLGTYEGLTIVVGWPKGLVAERTAAEKRARWLRDNGELVPGLAGIALLLAYYLAVWARYGRDPAGRTIIPRFAPPEDVSPADARFLERTGFDDRTFAAALVGLAVKGHLLIEEDEDHDYALERPHEAPDQPLLNDEQALLDALGIARGSRLDLRAAASSQVEAARKALKGALRKEHLKRHFVTNGIYLAPGLVGSILALVWAGVSGAQPEQTALTLFMVVWLSGWTFGVYALLAQAGRIWRMVGQGKWLMTIPALLMSAFALPFLGGEVFGLYVLTTQSSIVMVALLVVLIGINYAFYHLLRAPTLAGRKLMDEIAGFRMYLAVAEKDELQVRRGPARTLQLFEKYLPYALALGVENAWAEQFSDLLANYQGGGGETAPLRWYSGPSLTNIGSAGFAGGIASGLSGAIASATAPSGGGSSGGGGGGSSGGGGGGGGGGGW